MIVDNFLSDGASSTLEVFYDEACPLCRREVSFMRRLDASRSIRFTDISHPTFDAAPLDVPWATLMSRIHARRANGSWITGVDVFREIYVQLGFGRLVTVSRLPVVSAILNWGYELFARNRLRLTGRCGDESCSIRAS
jgi:predicted DCC family thiol-disulfide oxidoreductase YuxK